MNKQTILCAVLATTLGAASHSPAAAETDSAMRPRIAEQTSWASAGVATSPVPIAQTGS